MKKLEDVIDSIPLIDISMHVRNAEGPFEDGFLVFRRQQSSYLCFRVEIIDVVGNDLEVVVEPLL